MKKLFVSGFVALIACAVQAGGLFGVFENLGAPEPFAGGSLTVIGEDGAWTPGEWNISWSETNVFHAQLDHADADPAAPDWRIKIGKGGHLYSIDLPGLGEICPPQNTDVSPWTDDTWTVSPFSSEMNDHNLGQTGTAFSHQSGMYVKPEMDPLLVQPMYSPLLATEFDSTNRSYSVLNWALPSQPTVHRSDVLVYANYRHMGSGVLEITYYYYNFSDVTYDSTAVPWGGVRPSVYPEQIRALPGGGFESYQAEFSAVNYWLDEGGGWVAETVDQSDTNSPTFSLVNGVDKHYGEPGYEYQVGKTAVAAGVAGSTLRDFNVIATTPRCNVEPGEGFFFRTYMVMGSLGAVTNLSAQLVDAVDYGKLEFDPATTPRVPLYAVTNAGQLVLSDIPPGPGAIVLAESHALPVPDSEPLFLMKEKSSGTFVLSTDPYVVCGKRTLGNPFKPDDPEYASYTNLVIRRPFDRSTEWLGLLGFVRPAEDAALSNDYQRLSSLLGDDVLFAPGEKRSADELMIWTGSSEMPGTNSAPVFGPNPVELSVTEGQECSGTLSGTASDADFDSLTYSKVLGPAWLGVATNGALSGTPAKKDIGLNTFSVRVADGNGGSAVATLNVIVQPLLVVIDGPVSARASSEFSDDFPVSKLHDAGVSGFDVGTVPIYGGEYAGVGAGPHTVVYDMGSNVSFNTILYAQRHNSGLPLKDKIGQVELWVSRIDPGYPDGTFPILGAVADCTFNVSNVTNDNLTQYSLGMNLSGQFVVMRMTAESGSGGNQGWKELALGFDSAVQSASSVAIPVGATASTEFSAAYSVSNLFDGSVSFADVGTTDNQGGQYAGQGTGAHVVVYDFGSSRACNGILYAQRAGGDPFADKVGQVELWVTNTDPGAAALSLPILGMPVDEILVITNTVNNNLEYYAFEQNLSGRYVVMRLIAPEGAVGNIGGSELVLVNAAWEPLPVYQDWLRVFGMTGDDALLDADIEPDGINNLMEYALGGNPIVNDADTVLPDFQLFENYFYYVHNELTNDTNLTYTVLLSTNLLSNVWKTNGVEFVGEAGFSNVWKTVTNRIAIVNSWGFIKLNVELSEAN